MNYNCHGDKRYLQMILNLDKSHQQNRLVLNISRYVSLMRLLTKFSIELSTKNLLSLYFIMHFCLFSQMDLFGASRVTCCLQIKGWTAAKLVIRLGSNPIYLDRLEADPSVPLPWSTSKSANIQVVLSDCFVVF